MLGGRRSAVVIASLAAIVLAAPAASATFAGSRPQAARTIEAANALEISLLREINVLRRKHGLAPVRASGALRRAADAHSAAMVQGGFFQHDSADGSSFWKRIQRFYRSGSFRYWAVGENLLWSSPDVDAQAALQMWLDSPPHRKVLLTGKWREVGLSAVHASTAPGTFGGREVTVVTADFGVRR